MESVWNLLIIITYLVELSLLIYLEIKTWKTLYTPLLFLALPYTFVLLTTLCISDSFNFISFYYPSILIWCGGLLLFAIPSYTLGALLSINNKPVKSEINTQSFSKTLLFSTALITLLFIKHFQQILGNSTDFIGSDEFAEDFSGYGFWAHLRLFSLPILIMAIHYVDSKKWWLWPVIILMLLINVLNQVKGWIIIPVISGLALRLYSKRTKLNLPLLFYTLAGSFLVFIISYMLLPVLGNNGEFTSELLEFVFNHFFHYLTSGILGLSLDMIRDFPDRNSFDILITPFINIWNQIIGKEEILSPVNPFYLNTGLDLTNVRTFFGTIYIYTTIPQFIFYVLFFSTLMYLLKLATIKFNNIYVYVIYFFECGLLCMGWFEFYFFHLAMIEVPILTLFLLLIDKIFTRKIETHIKKFEGT